MAGPIPGSRSAAARIRSDGSRRVRSTSPPSHRRTASPSISTWSATHGQHVLLAPRVERLPHQSPGRPRCRAGPAAAATWRNVVATPRPKIGRGRGDRVPDADEPGDARPAVARPAARGRCCSSAPPGSTSVTGAARSGSVQAARPGMARQAASKAAAVPQVLQGRVGGRPDEDHREVAPLVQEHQHLVAVEVALPGQRVGHRPGLRAVAQAVLAVHVRHAARAADGGGRPQRVDAPTGPPGGVHHQVRLDR